jgi:hypothetical protein
MTHGGTEKDTPMRLALLLPLAATAEGMDTFGEGACQQTCEVYRDCAYDALQAIYNGTFQGECRDYNSCGTRVEQCRAASGTCEQTCSDPRF